MYRVIYYAVLPRMKTQRQRQTVKQHSAAPLSFHPLLILPSFFQLPRQADTPDTCFIHLQLHSQVQCHISAWVYPRTKLQEWPEPGAPSRAALPLPGGGAVGTGWIVFLTCPCPVLAILSIRPTPALVQLHPVLQVPSSSREGPWPELQKQVLVGTAQTRSPVRVHLAQQGGRHQVQLR